ncbi:phosphopantetheine adenylyltransferase [bacterium BMS3Bbin06]|nr:phosphopantetheine adenylyltransferase [bacterium BMS3Abin08]GBE34677.1 phosphopantetheine adenylyltransferase [bacterium BMS3Bbin06]
MLNETKRVAICPGTFDPITNGHIDIVKRSLGIFDEVIAAVAVNPKKKPLFDVDRRLDLMKKSLGGLQRLRIEPFKGLLVEYARQRGVVAIVRGLRAVSDFEYELQMALMNRRLDSEIEAVFMMPSEEYSFLSSTMVKEIASFGGDVRGLVPGPVDEALKEVFQYEK